MTVWNHGTEPVFISTKIIKEIFGGPGRMEDKIIIMPGDGIDLDILSLKPEKLEPKDRTKSGRTHE